MDISDIAVLNGRRNQPTPLRAIGVQSRINQAAATKSNLPVQCFRWPIVIGANASKLVLSMHNWYMNNSGVETNTGNAIQVLDMALESTAGTVSPVTFGGSGRGHVKQR